MFEQARAVYEKSLAEIRAAGLYKDERVIQSPQGAHIRVAGREVLNFCANNYLGLSSHPKVMDAAASALRNRGFGLSSVRFICGTQDIHKELERKISSFLGTEDSILYSSCFDANGGLFETLLGPDDAIISDALNHASSTAFASAKRGDIAMSTTTWQTSSASSRSRRTPGCG